MLSIVFDRFYKSSKIANLGILLLIIAQTIFSQEKYPNKQSTVQLKNQKAVSFPFFEALENQKGQNQEPKLNYDTLLTRIQTQRAHLSKQYQSANSEERSKIIVRSRNYIKQMIVDTMFEAWKGTPYDYSGMTEKPGQGGIACGYFITTVLKHAGFDVERMALAQKKSLYIAQTLSEEIHRYPNSSTGEFLKSMKEQPNGLYVLGLSQHAGFMIVRDSALVTCHAAYYPPLEVVQEKAGQSQAIQSSSYKVVGRLFTDALMKKWLNKTPIQTVD